MDILGVRSEFDTMAAAVLALIEAQRAAQAAEKRYLRRTHHDVAQECAGLPDIEAALERQRLSLAQFINAALRVPPAGGPEILALRDMLVRAIELIGPADDTVVRLSIAVADSLRPFAKPEAAQVGLEGKR